MESYKTKDSESLEIQEQDVGNMLRNSNATTSDDTKKERKERKAIATQERAYVEEYNLDKKVAFGVGLLAIGVGSFTPLGVVSISVGFGLLAVSALMNYYEQVHRNAAKAVMHKQKSVEVPDSTEFEEFGPEDFEPAEFESESPDLTEEA